MSSHLTPTIPQPALDAAQQLQSYPYIVDAVIQVFLADLLLERADSSSRIFSVKDASTLLRLYTLNAEALESQ
jgi:hypothetical protein